MLEVGIDEMSKVELKVPPGPFRIGYLQITRAAGEVAKVTVGRKQPGEQLRELLQVYAPNILAVL